MISPRAQQQHSATLIWDSVPIGVQTCLSKNGKPADRPQWVNHINLMQQENLNTPQSIRTVSGRYVNVFDADPDTIVIEDIAHALAHLPRFGGHLPDFFSVAQHSVMCMIEAPANLKLEALMHDASEAYLLDLPRPIKREIPHYRIIEDKLMLIIADKFGFRYPLDPVVKEIDQFQLEKEWHNLMLARTGKIVCLSPTMAKQSFLRHFRALTRNK